MKMLSIYLSTSPEERRFCFSFWPSRKGVKNMQNLDEQITITLPKTMPLNKRILETAKQLSRWLNLLGRPLDYETERLFLSGMEKNDKDYSYHYTILNRSQLPTQEAIDPVSS